MLSVRPTRIIDHSHDYGNMAEVEGQGSNDNLRFFGYAIPDCKLLQIVADRTNNKSTAIENKTCSYR